MRKTIDVNNMPFLGGISFGYDMKREDYFSDAPISSLEAMVEQTGANTVVFAFHAMQDDAQSTTIDYIGEETPTKEGLKRLIDKARELNLYVVLKPMLDCRNGTWRGHINFFDKDVPCEPKWSEWFAAYTEFQLHFAKIAEELEADMLCIACEMVQTQRRETEWRNCIAEIRKHYTGLITWNCDKYQEDEVHFWDALDVISASGYYPINNWEEQLDRIEAVVKNYNKPFFFIECGCMTCKSSPMIPNNWHLFGNELNETAKRLSKSPDDIDVIRQVVDFEAQVSFYREVFDKCGKRSFVNGFGLWDWAGKQKFDAETVNLDGGYEIYLKPSTKVVKEFFTSKY